VRTVWTEGEFNLDKMFPVAGDAAGFDSRSMPRPPSAKRILTATSAEVPFGVHVYESFAPEQSLRRFYDDEMGGRGWAPAKDDGGKTVAYVHKGAMSFVTYGASATSVLVTTIETARPDGSGVAGVAGVAGAGGTDGDPP
jgi:hypothetical protein